jgi:ketosteroid isomerase-like protein
MPETHDAVRELEQAWARAEARGDSAALDALSTDGFRLVGPAGFVLDKRQWLDRYREGRFVTHELSLEEPSTVVYDETAVTIGRQVQHAEYQGRPADGEFRVTLISVRADDAWRLAGIHLSPVGGPPPFAQQRPGERSRTGGEA